MATSAVALTKCSRTPSRQSDNGYRVYTGGKTVLRAGNGSQPRQESQEAVWSGGVMRHQTTQVNDQPSPCRGFPVSSPETGGRCLSALRANEFLPRSAEKREEVEPQGDHTPCTRHDLSQAVAALVAANRAQSEELVRLSCQWSASHKRLQGTIRGLKASLRQHRTILMSVVRHLREGHLGAEQWAEVEACMYHFPGGTGETFSSDSEDHKERREREEGCWDANELLSSTPEDWTGKVFHWACCVDGLPVGISQQASSVGVKGDNENTVEGLCYSGGDAEGDSLESSSDTEGSGTDGRRKGLRVHVVGYDGRRLSPPAERDAARFCDFISNASLRQEAWLETFSSFAVTAAPVAVLSHANTLRLKLLDEAVTLPASDLLLLVAESVDHLGFNSIKSGLRVLCLLERPAAARCNVRSRSLRKGTIVSAFAFVPFSVCVEPSCDDSDSISSGSHRKMLTIPVCSLQGVRIEREAPSSVSGSEIEDSREAKSSSSVERACSTTGNQTCTASSKREQGRERCGASGPDTEEAVQQSPESSSVAKKRRVQEEVLDFKEHTEGDKEQQQRPQQDSQPLATPPHSHPRAADTTDTDGRSTPLQTRNCNSNSSNRVGSSSSCCSNSNSNSSSSSSLGASVPVHAMKKQSFCSDGDSGVLASALKGRVGTVASRSRGEGEAKAVGETRGSANKDGAEASECSSAVADCVRSANAEVAAAAAVDSRSSRSGPVVSLRCSGQAARQELERIQQQLPRVRATVPKAVRQQLPAYDCQECAAFFDLMESAGGSAMPVEGTSGDGKWQTEEQHAQSNRSASGQQRVCTKHRQFAPPSSTPPGYWDL